MNDRVAGFRAGCDLNMPGGSNYMGSACAKALHAGKLSGEDVDRCARRVLALAERAAEARKEKSGFDRQAHHALAREAAESGAVLLKNNGVLPFRKGQRIALIGAMVDAAKARLREKENDLADSQSETLKVIRRKGRLRIGLPNIPAAGTEKEIKAAQFGKAVRVDRDCHIEVDFSVSFEAFQRCSFESGTMAAKPPQRSHTA